MRLSLLKRYSVVCLTAALAACGTTLVPETPAPLPPDMTATRQANTFVQSGPCFDLDRAGLGEPVARPGTNEFVAGFSNTLRRGADPFPCNRQSSAEFKGAVHFDMTAFRSVVVDRATLVLRRRPALPWRPRDGVSATTGAPISRLRCAVAVVPATASWTPGFASGAAGSPAASLPSPEPATDPRTHGFVGLHSFDEGVTTQSLDVTHAVQNWANGRPNFGLVIFQRKEFGGSVAANDESCTSLYSGVTLELQIRRFVRSTPAP
jgi:hypothetical protein